MFILNNKGLTMKKIVFVVPDMAGGGTEKVITLLANEYVKRGIPVGILTYAGNEYAYQLDSRVERFCAAMPSAGNLKVRLERFRKMREYFKTNKGCKIFSFSTIGTGFVVLSTLFMKRDMMVSERTDPQTCDHKLYRDFFYHFAHTLVCQTPDGVTCFPKSLQKRACVIGNPVSESIANFYDGERKKEIVTVGRLQPVKNQKMLINAFSIFEKEYSDYTLHFYGKGPLEKELKDQVKQLELENKVVFHGFSTKVDEEIRESSMFVLSSNYEGVSNSMVEALALGIPAIATDCPIGGCKMYIKHSENGLLVPVGDEKALAEAMKQLAANPELAKKMSLNAREVRKEYSIQRIADMMLKAAKYE